MQRSRNALAHAFKDNNSELPFGLRISDGRSSRIVEYRGARAQKGNKDKDIFRFQTEEPRDAAVRFVRLISVMRFEIPARSLRTDFSTFRTDVSSPIFMRWNRKKFFLSYNRRFGNRGNR